MSGAGATVTKWDADGQALVPQEVEILLPLICRSLPSSKGEAGLASSSGLIGIELAIEEALDSTSEGRWVSNWAGVGGEESASEAAVLVH